MVMNLPDDSQWDETTCEQAVCQHPQCWASIHRIERGHPRIMGVPGKSPLDAEGKLPVVTIVNISDSSLHAKRLAHRQLSHLPFSKTCSSLSQGSKLKSKHPSRLQSLPDKKAVNQIKFPKLSILNFNGTELPCSEVARNMVVVWIPKVVEKKESSVEKSSACQRRTRAKKKLPGKSQPPQQLSRSQYFSTESKTPQETMHPPSPVHMLERLTSPSAPDSAHRDGVPQDLLEECLLPDVDKDVSGSDMKMQLAMMKKNLPLDKARPGSAISSKMFLTIHRLTLQRRSLQQPEHLKKSQKKQGFQKKQLPQMGYQWSPQQHPQKRLVNTPVKKQRGQKLKMPKGMQEQEEKEKEVQSDLGTQRTSRHTTPQDHESEQKLAQKEKGQSLKMGSMAYSVMNDLEHYMAFYSSSESTVASDVEVSKRQTSPTELKTDYSPTGSSATKQEGEYSYTEPGPAEQDVSQGPVASQATTFTNFSESPNEFGWNPELKLLRIIQAAAEEEEKSQTWWLESEESLEG
ncbi:uncharacterized protein C9orf43 homolog isoform 2-T2 [Thomomys bottae]